MIHALITRYGLSIGKWAAIAGGILLVLLRVRKAGTQAQKIETLEKQHEVRTQSIRKTNAIKDDVRRIDSNTARNELHTNWGRD